MYIYINNNYKYIIWGQSMFIGTTKNNRICIRILISKYLMTEFSIIINIIMFYYQTTLYCLVYMHIVYKLI